jgi:hypothetical protein
MAQGVPLHRCRWRGSVSAPHLRCAGQEGASARQANKAGADAFAAKVLPIIRLSIRNGGSRAA